MADEQIRLKDYPPMFNGTAVPFFPEIDNSPINVEKVNQSEGGRDIVQRIRTDKLSSSVKMEVAGDEWDAFFYSLFKDTSAVVFKQYNSTLQGYETRDVRITNFKHKCIKHSEELTSVVGVWNISFNMEEI